MLLIEGLKRIIAPWVHGRAYKHVEEDRVLYVGDDRQLRYNYVCISRSCSSVVRTYFRPQNDDLWGEILDKGISSEYVSEFCKGVIHTSAWAERLATFFNLVYYSDHPYDQGGSILIPRTLPEIINEFDPDIEGIEPTEFSEQAKRAHLEEERRKHYRRLRLRAASEDADPVLTKKLHNGLVEHYARRTVERSHVVRGVKTLKRLLDERGVHYRTPEEVGLAVERLKNALEKHGIGYEIKWV